MANEYWDAANNAFAMGQKTAQAYHDRQQEQVNQQAGNAFATGDYAGGANALYRSGDLANGQAATTFGQAQQDRVTAQKKAVLADQTTATLAGLRALRGITDPTQRAQYLTTVIAPTLKQRGVPDAGIAHIAQIAGDNNALQAEETSLGQEAAKWGFTDVGGTLIAHNDQSSTVTPVYQGAVKPEHITSKADENLYVSPGTPGHVIDPNAPQTPTPAAPPVSAAPVAAAAQGGNAFDPKAFFKTFTGPHEGGLNPHDANGSPTNFGINQAANPNVDVTKLTPDQAGQIFASKYYAPFASLNLPPAMAGVVADTAFINPGAAKRFLAQSGGDPQKFMDLRDQWMQGLVASNPAKFGKYAQAWSNRNRDLRAYAAQAGGTQSGAPASGPPQTLPGGFQLVHAAEADKPEGHASTAEEIKAARLPEGTAAWTGKDGKPVPYPEAFQPPPVPGPNSGLTGDAYLKTLPLGYAKTVQAIANGDAAMPSLRTPYGQKLQEDVFQYDPTASAANLPTRIATQRQFKSGKYSQTITALNQVIHHVNSLDHSITALGNTPLDWVNGPAQWAGQHLGNADTQAAVADFNTFKTNVANELTTVYRGTGGAEADIQNWMKQLDSAKSPAALHATVRAMVEGLDARLSSLGDTYTAGMGREEDPLQFLRGDTKQIFDRLHGAAPSNTPPAAPPGHAGPGWRVVKVH
jgi:hypothetical protein